MSHRDAVIKLLVLGSQYAKHSQASLQSAFCNKQDRAPKPHLRDRLKRN